MRSPGRRFVPNWHQHKRVRVHFQQLEAWYRTLDQLVAAKEKIEVALYHRLRDLFSFKPDLVLYDITSTYFEAAGPADFAKHGHSRDGKPHNVQVIVAVVMVSGWPIPRITSGPATRWTTPPSARPSPTCTGDSGSTAWSSSAIEVWSPVIISMRIHRGESRPSGGPAAARNKQLDRRLAAVDEAKRINCPVGITAREKTDPPRTRAQEVPSGVAGMRADHRRFRRCPAPGGDAWQVDEADARGVGETAASR